MDESVSMRAHSEYDLPCILVVHDDARVLAELEHLLWAEGYGVITAHSGHQALATLQRHGLPHLVIIDVVMPDMDGLAFGAELQAWVDLPIVIVSDISREETIARAIRCCAEDYIVRPLRPREFVARVDRILRRTATVTYTRPRLTRLGPLAIDCARRQVHLDGATVTLTPTENKLLYILLCNAGTTVSTPVLLKRLWPLDDVCEDALRVHIRHLREKIEPNPAHPSYIVTERGVGYRFVVP